MNSLTESISNELISMGNKDIAEHSSRFFKTGKGEYGEGDIFIGIRIPELRKQAKKYKQISLDDSFTLLKSPYHEIRLFSLFILVEKFKKADHQNQEEIYTRYLQHKDYINNWDLVDSSAHLIVGPYLISRNREILYTLARSGQLFDRRIAIMSTFCFIKANDYDDTLKLADILLSDPEDLIQKAVGWMLRELGNRDLALEEDFLKNRYKKMPRTMLRYAIEKFEESKRKSYLKGEI